MKEIKTGIYRVIVDDSHCGKKPSCVECACGCGYLLWKKSPAILFKGDLISLGCAVREKIITRDDIVGRKEEKIIQTKSDFLSGKIPVGFGEIKEKKKEEPKEEVSDDIELWLSGGLLTKVQS